jgi:hypothetical protein
VHDFFTVKMSKSLPTAVAGTVFLGVLLLAREYNTFKQVKPAISVFRPQWPQMTTLDYQKPFVPIIEPELRPTVVLDFEGPFLTGDRDVVVREESVVWSGTTYMTGVLAILALLVVCVGMRKPRAVGRATADDHTNIQMMNHALQAHRRRRAF